MVLRNLNMKTVHIKSERVRRSLPWKDTCLSTDEPNAVKRGSIILWLTAKLGSVLHGTAELV